MNYLVIMTEKQHRCPDCKTILVPQQSVFGTIWVCRKCKIAHSDLVVFGEDY